MRQNITYDYDALKRLTKVYDNGTLIATYAYDANGNRASLAYNNGITATYAYNKANMVTSLDNKLGTTPVSSYSYTYYLDGNQETKTDNTGKITTYVYDGLGRLKSEAETGIPSIIKRAYTYDTAGNRATMAVTGTETYDKTYTYDANNRLITETTTIDGTASTAQYTYDDNGNQLTRTEAGVTETNGYDMFNRLTSAVKEGATAAYAYKPDGLRLSKTVNGVKTTHIWNGSNIALDLDGSNAVVDSYLRGINLIKSQNNGYYLYNAHGDVTKLTDAAGAVTKSYEYDAFGVEQGQDENDANPWRYCGEYFDKETDTVYLRNRYYNPSNGRFLSEDPIQSGLNWYTYCSNNPIALIDPSGLVEVGLRAYAATYAGATVSWNEKTKTATVAYNGKSFSVTSTAQNNRNGSIYVDDSLFVKAFGNGTKALTVYQSGNNVSIRANVSISGWAANKTISNTSTTYRQAAISGIQDNWSGLAGKYDVSTYVTDVGRSGASVPINIKNGLGVSIVSGWKSYSDPGKTTLYQGDNRNNPNKDLYSLTNFQYVSAHEFGHSMGVGDAYSKAGQAVTDIAVYGKSLMIGWVHAQEADITMVLKAYSTNSWQNWSAFTVPDAISATPFR